MRARPVLDAALSSLHRIPHLTPLCGLLRPVLPPSSLQRELLRQDGFPKHEPDGMAWCGNDAVALYFRGNALLLVGPKGESLEFLSERSETLCLGQEVCGRINGSVPDSDCGALTRVSALARLTHCA